MGQPPKLTFKDRMSFSMTEARAARWGLTRKGGKKKFILKTGVLAWGIPMFVIMTFFLNDKPYQELSPLYIAGSGVIWALAGAFFGWLMWAQTERQYAKSNLQEPTKKS